MIKVRVFGGLRLWREGIEVEIGSIRIQTTLAVLLAARGATVGVAELVDTLWGDRPPASAENQIQRLIGQVRRLFEPDLPNREPGNWLLPVGEGYRLRQDARTSDLMAFFEMAGRQQFDQALTLAQERPFAGLPAGVLGLPAFTAIETARIEVAVQAADLPLLSTYAQSAPFHEPLQARLIRLLTAAGRRAEALAHFEAVRQRLSEELGADPGAELQAAHREALTDLRPIHLPPRVTAFSPRPELTAAVQAGRRAGLVVLSGMGGAGKTTLAVDWAHRIAADYPDGQLYLDLRGFAPAGRQLRPAEALTSLLISMGATPEGDGPDTLTGQFRSALADRRMIVLLDNARDSAQVRPLLPASPGSLVIVTSRNRMPSLVAREGAWPVYVGRLVHSAAKDMLHRRLGAPRLAAEPAATDKLVEICAGLPLALSIAAARIAVSPEESLADVVADLSAGHGLDALDTGEEHDSVRAAFSWSYRVLSEPAARLFRLLAVHPSADVSAETAASIAGADVRAALAELTVTSMLTPLGAGRYTAHDLLKVYAAELSDEGRPDAERRLVEHYLHSSRNAYLTFKLLPPADPGPPPPGVHPSRPVDMSGAHDWYRNERAAVQAVTDLALRRGWARAAALIMVHVRPMRSSQPRLSAELRDQAVRAVEAVAGLGDPELETLILREAAVQLRAHSTDRARDYLLRALAITQARGDLVGQAQILRNLAVAPITEGRGQVTYAERAVGAARRAGEPSVLVYALDMLARMLDDYDEPARAAAVAAEAFDLAGDAGLTDMRCLLAAARAWIALRLGDDEAASRMAAWALDHIDPADEVTTWTSSVILALASHNLGDTARARAEAERSRALVQGREDVFAEVIGDDYFVSYMARVDGVLAAEGTAIGSQ
ncbi:AfsR/SARP family transcriptional regulator [Paractinoplanes atraurantiacus]|uniref:DNA-binding transcriptional activator of the SARP family n=1 Tax=Paractinoplanes atraurantiacus TaxID=1036182 RepID=A0A285KJ78_9ACTN|nr:BTAD domain-containing putative transcriptional regulator [Actinoplanes atraurantiacus]SNY72283.1 DNA-binding transcriptional activator of the SARP family [Actinoplanes atraurantiacus]